MNHDHSHHCHHSHEHSKSGNSGLWLAFGLNLGFCLVEAFGGYYASSQAVMADALHDFGDSLSLAVLLGLRWLAIRPAAPSYSFGYRRLNFVGTAFVGATLVLGSIFLLGRSVPLLLNPQPVQGSVMFGLALLGIGVNGLSFYRLKSHSGTSEALVRLHLLEDLWGWVIVLLGAVVIYFWSWYWVDPLLSVFLSFYILWRSYGPMREMGRLLLLGGSAHFQNESVRNRIERVHGVLSVHHIHVWELDFNFHIVTAHLVVVDGIDIIDLKKQVREALNLLGPCEVTLEIERADEVCLDPVHPSDI